ncbi:hypothetical protein PIB30_033059, partial [Stylosanthes scabra]|nr:hypothetical protein [Stylosanthes scabra]
PHSYNNEFTYIVDRHIKFTALSSKLCSIANDDVCFKFIGVEKSMRKAKKNIGSKNDLEKACKSGDFTKKEECEAEKRSYSHQIGANFDSLEI